MNGLWIVPRVWIYDVETFDIPMCSYALGPGRRVSPNAVVRTRFQASTPAGAKTRNATPLRLGFATPPRLLVCAIGYGLLAIREALIGSAQSIDEEDDYGPAASQSPSSLLLTKIPWRRRRRLFGLGPRTSPTPSRWDLWVVGARLLQERLLTANRQQQTANRQPYPGMGG